VGEPAGRPVDADPSGGYYQPIGLFDYDQSEAGLFEARVACSLPGVTRAQFTEWTMRYVRNRNPEIDGFEALSGGEVLALDGGGAALHVSPGEKLELRVWTPLCGSEVAEDAACGGAEPYLYFDLTARELVTRTETLNASWFANAGRFSDSRTRVESAEEGGLGASVWTAPRDSGPVDVWVVVRDNRGGVVWRSAVIEVD
jgi:hypothetical protein